jgi:small subunit ribosomal protein S17
MSEKKIARRTKIGSVISNKMDKSVVVQIDRRIRHKLYGKSMHKRVKYMVDDPNNICNVGDLVLIEECRPLSKNKRWRVRSVVEKAV